jgi:hypothetical protein
MATVESYTKAKIDALIDATIVDADVVAGELVFTKEDGTTINLGKVAGGIIKATAFPTVPPPTDGDMVVRTDQPADPLYKFTDGAWELQPRMGALTVPSARVRRTTAQSIVNGTMSVVGFDTVDHDTNTLWSSGASSRLTIKTPGLYLVSANVDWVNNAAGSRDCWVQRNGNSLDRVAETMGGPATTGDSRQNLASVVRLAAGDYLELGVYQGSGGALNITPATNESNLLTATWLGGAGQTVDERGIAAVRAAKSIGGASQAVPHATYSAISFDNEEYDTDGMHDTVTNNSRITIKTPGLYDIKATVLWQANTVGTRFLYLRKNGSGNSITGAIALASSPTSPAYETAQQISATLLLAAGDYLEVVGYQESGGPLNVIASSGSGSTAMSAVLVGSAKTVTPFAKVFKSANQSVPNSTVTIVAFDSEINDNDSIHDTVTNNSRLTCRTAGVYLVRGHAIFSSNGVGTRAVSLFRNGNTNDRVGEIVLPPASTSSFSTAIEVETLIELAAGDYLEMYVYQDSGGALTLQGGQALSPHHDTTFSMVKVGAPTAAPTGVEAIEGWHQVGAAGEPAFQNAFVNAAAGANPLKFYKDRGVVRLSGVITGGGPNTTIFQLPPGYRSATDHYFAGMRSNSQTPVMVWVGSDGTVKVMSAAGDSTDLSCISFRADGA